MDVQTWSAAATIVGTVVGAAYVLVHLLLKKFEQIEGKIDKVGGKFDTTRTELKADIGTVSTTLGARIDKLDTKIGATRDEVKAENTAARNEMNARFSEVKGELSEIRADLRFLTQRTFDLVAHPPTPVRAEGE